MACFNRPYGTKLLAAASQALKRWATIRHHTGTLWHRLRFRSEPIRFWGQRDCGTCRKHGDRKHHEIHLPQPKLKNRVKRREEQNRERRRQKAARPPNDLTSEKLFREQQYGKHEQAKVMYKQVVADNGRDCQA